MNSRLALGTAQFGMRYGVANQAGQVTRDEAAAILDHAWAKGLDTLDTAIAYGESERLLGEIGVGGWRVISKLPAMPKSRVDAANWVREAVDGSLERLKISALRGLLLHRSQELLEPYGSDLYGALAALRDEGRVEKIGVSIYDPVELDAVWPRYRLDLVQAPFNILDRRLASSGWLTRLHEGGTEVHVRSAFLQGLLLMSPFDRPAKFNRWQPLWDKWQHWLDEEALTPLRACLGFAYSQSEIDRVVVGVDSLQQLHEILVGAKGSAAEPPAALTSGDLDLINPSRWNLF